VKLLADCPHLIEAVGDRDFPAPSGPF